MSPTESQPRKNYVELYDIIMPDGICLREEDWCFTHSQYCRRLPRDPSLERNGVLDLVVGGSPCPDWSNFGKHGAYAGASAPAFMVLTLVLKGGCV